MPYHHRDACAERPERVLLPGEHRGPRPAGLQTGVQRPIHIQAGVYKVPYNLIFLPTPISFLILIFFPEISVPFPFSPLDILPNSFNILGKMILLTCSHVIFFLTAMIFPSLLHNLLFFKNSLDKELYRPLYPG